VFGAVYNWCVMEKYASLVLPKGGSTKLQWALPMVQSTGQQVFRLLL